MSTDWNWKTGFIKSGYIDCIPDRRNLIVSGWHDQVEIKRFKYRGYETVFVVHWSTGNWEKIGERDYFKSHYTRKYKFDSEEKALKKFYKLVMNKIK